MRLKSTLYILLFLLAQCSYALQTQTTAPAANEFVKVDASIIALTHVRVIDGTGAPAAYDQTIIIEGWKIQSIGPAAQAKPPDDARVLDLRGYTVIPGLVGLHEHLFYTSLIDGSRTPVLQQMNYSFPRLYLANGVTTIRTAGSIAPDMDLNLKQRIDAVEVLGPRIHLTGPFIGRSAMLEMADLHGAEQIRRAVNYWADRGVTSFKAYIHITRDELRALIEEAHKRGLKVTGHLCSVSFREAAEMGIDNIEHGFAINTETIPGKKPDVCPPNGFNGLANVNVTDKAAQEIISFLVQRRVAITSTLPVFEQYVSERPSLPPRVLDAMTSQSRASCLAQRARINSSNSFGAQFKKEMQFEQAFVKAGGLLVAGSDPTGNGCIVAGFGMHREVELLVEAGFTPVQAIQIATGNGAQFLGESARIGTLQPGKQADIVVIRGDPSTRIEDIEKIEIVFKDGIGYDSAKLLESVRGQVGSH